MVQTMDAARANMRMRESLSTRSLYAAAFPSISIRSLYAASRALINWEILCNAVLRDEVRKKVSRSFSSLSGAASVRSSRPAAGLRDLRRAPLMYVT